MGFQGNLRTMHLGDVLQNISQNRSNGNLRIFTKELGDVDLFFMEGELTLYHSKNLEDIQWSRVLLAKGLLTEEEVGVIESQGIRGEEELAGIISSQVIGEDKAAISFQHIIEEEIYELFMISDCDFNFESLSDIPIFYTYTDLFKRTLFNTNVLLMEAARRSDENSQEGNISSREIFMQVQNKEKAIHSNLNEEEWRIFDLIDGFRNVSEIVRDSGNKRQEVVKVLKNLVELKLIKISETKDLLAKASHLSSIQDYDSAAKVYRRLVDMEKAVLKHRELLADTFLKLQQKDNAIMQLEIMSNEYMQRKDFKKANEGLQKILEIDATRISVREVIANNYIEMGRKRDAISELKGVLQQYTDSGVFEKAKSICIQLLAIEPEDLKIMDIMAKTCVNRGERAQAVELWLRMSEIYFKKELYDDSTETLKKVLKIEPSNDKAKEIINTISVKLGKAKTRQMVVIIAGSIILFALLVFSGFFYIEQRVKRSLDELIKSNEHIVAEVKISKKQKEVTEKSDLVITTYKQFKTNHPYSFTVFEVNLLIDEISQLRDTKIAEFSKQSIDRIAQLDEEYVVVMDAADKKRISVALKELEEYKIKIEGDQKLLERMNQISSKIKELEQLEVEAESKIKEVAELLKNQKVDKANQISDELLLNYKRTSVIDKVQYYISISSSEPDCKLVINNEDKNKTLPLIYAYKPEETLKIDIKKAGYIAYHDEVSKAQKSSVIAVMKRKILWKYNMQNPINATPIFKDGSLLLFTRNGRIISLGLEFESDTYRELWSYKMNLPSSDIFTAGVVENDIAFVGSSDKNLYCLNISAGREYWKKTLNGPINSAVGMSNVSLRQEQKLVFVATSDSNDEGLVYGLDAKTGNIEWQKKIRGRAFSDILATNAKIYIGTDQNKIISLRASTGQIIETEASGGQMVPVEYKGFGQFKGSLLLKSLEKNEYLFASSMDQNIYCFNEKTGVKLWSYQTNSPNHTGLTSDGTNLFNSSMDGLITSIKIVESIQDSKAVLNWSLRYENFKEPTQICVTDSILYVGGTSEDKKGKLLAIRKNDGKLLWTLETPSSINSKPLVAEDRIFVGCDDNQLYVLKELK